MISYVDYISAGNFYIRGSYNPETDEEASVGPLMLLPHQYDILSHALTPDDKGNLPYTTVLYSCIKKSGKTTIGASVGDWFSKQIPANSESFCLAGDFEHAMGRMFADIEFNVRHQKSAKVARKDLIIYPNQTIIQALAQEYKSAAGSRHALTLWDELWTYISDSSRRLWVEMTPIKIPGVPTSLRFIATYAGFEGESELLWDLYQDVVINGDPVPELTHITNYDGDPVCWHKGRMFAYWDSVPRMPWQTQDYYDEQIAILPPADFMRLHENQWVTGSEPFMPVEWWDQVATLDGDLVYDSKNSRRSLPVVIGCDASTKHDSTALVGVQYDYDNDLITIAFHAIWTPTPGEPMDFERTLERYILERHNEGFHIASIVYDPTQLHRSMTRMKAIIGDAKVKEFSQTVNNMSAASETLYNLFKNKKILTYKDDQMRDHMKYAMAESKGRGFRIVKPKKSALHHTDAAVALAMATYEAFNTRGYDTSAEIRLEVPFADGSAWEDETPVEKLETQNLPPQLRSGGMTDKEKTLLWNKYVKSGGR